MKTHITAVVLVLWFGFSAIAQTTTMPAAGNGSSSSPYEIASLENLYWIAAEGTIDGFTPAQRMAFHYRQTATINAAATETWFSGAGWLPIGNATTPFRGVYDGQNFQIQNLFINRPSGNNVGLFGVIGDGTLSNQVIVRNVIINGVRVTGNRGVGTLSGRVSGNIYTLIEGCAAFGPFENMNVTGGAATGGLVGSNNSIVETPGGNDNPIISKSYAYIDVLYSGVSQGELVAEKFGGLAGCNQKGTIRDSYALGSVTANKNDTWQVRRVGGIAGCIIHRGRIERSYSIGRITATGGVEEAGGLVGNTSTGGNAGVVEFGYWNTETSGLSTSAAGSGRTSAQMKQQATFTGFNFTDVWEIDQGNDYPELRNIPQTTTYITWQGTNNNRWKTSGNWNLGRTPRSTDVIVIPSPSPGKSHHAPIIDTIVVLNNAGLSIFTGASLTISPEGSLTMNGFILNGNGINGLIIQSNANGSGSLIHTSKSLEATVQRFIPGISGGAWHQLSVPLSGQAISPAKSSPNLLYAWYEPTQSWVAHGQESVFPRWSDLGAGDNSSYIPGRGYMMSSTFAPGNNPTLQFQGTLVADTASVGLFSFANSADAYRGYNLIGNPFPAAIDWKADGHWSGRENLYSDSELGYPMWIWNDQAEAYGVYHSGAESDVGTHGVGRYIPPMQAFWVKTENHGARVYVYHGAKTHMDNDTWLKSGKAPAPPGNIRIFARHMETGRKDEILIETGHPRDMGGAAKMFGFSANSPDLYLADNNKNYSIRFLPDLSRQDPLILGFSAGREGSYVLEISGSSDLAAFVLFDQLSGLSHKLSPENPYVFHATRNDSQLRFQLLPIQQGSPTDIPDMDTPGPEVHSWVFNNVLHVNNADGSAEVSLYTLGGSLAGRYLIGHGHQTIQLNLPSGVYLKQIRTESGVHNQRFYVR